MQIYNLLKMKNMIIIKRVKIYKISQIPPFFKNFFELFKERHSFFEQHEKPSKIYYLRLRYYYKD